MKKNIITTSGTFNGQILQSHQVVTQTSWTQDQINYFQSVTVYDANTWTSCLNIITQTPDLIFDATKDEIPDLNWTNVPWWDDHKVYQQINDNFKPVCYKIFVDPKTEIMYTVEARIPKGKNMTINQLYNLLNSQITNLDTKVTGIDNKVSALDAKVNTLDTKVNTLDKKVSGIDKRLIAVEKDLADTKVKNNLK